MKTELLDDAFWKAALESAGQGVWDYDIRTGRRDHSDWWHHIRGLVPGVHVTWTDEEWLNCIHPDDLSLAQDRTNRLNAGELAEIAYEYRERHADGHWVWIMCRGRAIEWDKDGKPCRFVGTDTDITRIKASEDQVKAVSRRLELALSSVQIGVLRYDVNRDEVHWDDRLRSIYGLEAGASVPRDIWERSLHPDDREAAIEVAQNALQQRTDYEDSYRIVRPDGTVRFLHSRVSYQKDLIGGPIMVGINWDATDQHERSAALEAANRLAAARNAELEHIALHDILTGLPNRRKLDQVWKEYRRKPLERIAIFHIDLDRFKLINDVFGHDVGDFVLGNTAAILRDGLPDGALLARVGGDEFTLFYPDAPDDAALGLFAADMIMRVSQPVTYLGNECRNGVSIGVAVSEHDVSDSKSLFINADLAMYRAKKDGRGRYCFFHDAMMTETLAVKQLADEILEGIERDAFFCVYQPQFSAKTRKVTGVEALVRWNTKSRGVLQPADFLPIAEELGLLGRIDQIVLRKSAADFRMWAGKGVCLPRLSVNLSRARLRDPHLSGELATLGAFPGQLSMEVLESNFLDIEDPVVDANLLAIRAAGVEIEMDDFGSGYASIVSLLRLRPERLKIDRALIRDLGQSEVQAQLVGAIIGIGHQLGISITAEGIENEEQIKVLKAMGCDELQGFALAMPMTSTELIGFLAGYR